MASPDSRFLRFPTLYVRAALTLLVEGASRLRPNGIVTPDLSENQITYHLCHEMEAVQRADTSSILLVDYRVGTPSDPADPSKTGEIDIKFRWIQFPLRNDRYLAVEAKRLRGTGDSLAGKYVEEGVLDFVSGKYSRSQDHGIMVGYVIVAPVEKAVAAVYEALARRRNRTVEQTPFAPDSALCSHPHTHHSAHFQHSTNCLVTLVHLFVDFSGPLSRPV